MKYILILTVFVSINLMCEAQDSANIRVSGVILKGREADIVGYVIKTNPNEFPILDSVIKVLYVNKPANGDNVPFNSIPNKEWVRMFKKVANNSTAQIKSSYSILITELQLHGGVFINHRINLFNTAIDDDFTAIKKLGQNYAQKKDDGDSF